MGIPKFFGYLRKSGFRGVFQAGVPSFVSSLLIDANGLIHQAAQKVYGYGIGDDPIRREKIKSMSTVALESELQIVLTNLILKLVNEIQPREQIVIAVDGVAPAAKIQQQRQRRYRAAAERGSDAPFDSNAITPGTELMIRLDKFLGTWLIEHADLLPPTIIYSSYQVPGEGEHKIMDLIREQKVKTNGATVIHGLDADLFVLALLSPLEHVFLYREDFDSVVNVGNYRTGLIEKYGTFSMVDNFSIIMSLLGNDFLPHHPMFEDMGTAIELMLQICAEQRLVLTEGGRIRVPDLHELIHQLSDQEPEDLAKRAVIDYKHPSRMFQIALEPGNPPIFDYQVFRSVWYANAFQTRDVRVEWIEDMSQKYINGLEWIYRYYKFGMSSVSTRYIYPYYHAPLMTDLDVLQLRPTLLEPEATPIKMGAQLLAVLPPASYQLLNTQLLSIAPHFDVWAPKSFQIERDALNTDWQGISLVHPIDIDVIQSVVDQLPKDVRFELGSNLVITRNPEMSQLLENGRAFQAKVSELMKKRISPKPKFPTWRDPSLLQ